MPTKAVRSVTRSAETRLPRAVRCWTLLGTFAVALLLGASMDRAASTARADAPFTAFAACAARSAAVHAAPDAPPLSEEHDAVDSGNYKDPIGPDDACLTSALRGPSSFARSERLAAYASATCTSRRAIASVGPRGPPR